MEDFKYQILVVLEEIEVREGARNERGRTTLWTGRGFLKRVQKRRKRVQKRRRESVPPTKKKVSGE